MKVLASAALPEASCLPSGFQLTVFVCANSGRPGLAPTSASRPRPITPNFDWPSAVREVIVPCSGRLQPEHILKAFESGASLVCVIGCRENNCHFAEGSRRCARRIEFIRQTLDEIGLGGNRLLFLHLPGTAAEDMALACGINPPERDPAVFNAEVAAIRDQVIGAWTGLSCSPLFIKSAIPKVRMYPEEETDISNGNNGNNDNNDDNGNNGE